MSSFRQHIDEEDCGNQPFFLQNMEFSFYVQKNDYDNLKTRAHWMKLERYSFLKVGGYIEINIFSLLEDIISSSPSWGNE